MNWREATHTALIDAAAAAAANPDFLTKMQTTSII